METVLIDYLKKMFAMATTPSWDSEKEGIIFYDQTAHKWVVGTNVGWEIIDRPTVNLGDINTRRWLDAVEYPSDDIIRNNYITTASGELVVYSEDTIKTYGDYSLKAVATISGSKDELFYKNLYPAVYIEDRNYINFDVMSSRTGTNLQIEFNAGVSFTVGSSVMELTIDSSKIDSDLTNFPIPIILSSENSSLIYDELGLDYQKIKVLKADTISNLYVEVSQYDSWILYVGSEVRKSQCTASSEYNASYQDYMAFDGDNSNQYGWISNSSGAETDGSCWLQFNFESEKIIMGMRMLARNGGSSSSFPEDIKIYGSATGSFGGEETHLGDFTLSQPSSEGEACDWVYISSPTSFQYLRIEIHTQQAVPGQTESTTWVAVSEVEFYDNDVVDDIILWVSKSDFVISSSEDTILYIDYTSTNSDNNTYVGLIGSSQAENVWDGNYKVVYHMNQDPSGGSNCIIDSTSNNNHGTPAGTMTSDDIVNGTVGKAINFDGTDDDITSASNIGISGAQERTFEFICNIDAGNEALIGIGADTSGAKYGFRTEVTPVDGFRVSVNSGNRVWPLDLTTADRHISVTFPDSDDLSNTIAYSGGEEITPTSTVTETINTTDTTLVVGAMKDATANAGGIIDEVRVSDVVRSGDWIKANYYAQSDNLISYVVGVSGQSKTHDINIQDSNVWQGETVSLASISGSCSKITLTVLNDDTENTFYIDNIYADNRIDGRQWIDSFEYPTDGILNNNYTTTASGGEITLYTEPSLTTWGDYALKCVATISGSKDYSFQRVLSPAVNISGKDYIKFDTRASRVGTNIKFSLTSDSWLSDWLKRVKITIDSVNIDSDLTHFPVPIVLGQSVGQNNDDVTDIFDEIGSNSKKIAITKEDGVTQLYGEIEHWSLRSWTKGTANTIRDIGSDDDGTATLTVYGSPVDNGTYYTFDGSSNGLWKNADLGNSATEVGWVRARIHDKNKGAAQIIWKDGGYSNGVAFGIDASGNIGIFGQASSTDVELSIPPTEYSNGVWYDIFFTQTRVSIVDTDTQKVIATVTGSCVPGNGGADESLGYSTDQSPITGTTSANTEFFDGDIDTVEIYTEGDLVAPDYSSAVIWTSKSDLTITSGQDTTLYLYYDSTKPDNTSDYSHITDYDTYYGSSLYTGTFDLCFDGNTSTRVELGAENTGWVGCSFNTSCVINRLDMLSRQDTEGDRCPSEFEVRASNSEPSDGLTEGTVLFNVSDIYWELVGDTGKTFIFENSIEYTHYWVTCLDKRDNFGKGSEYNIAEIEFYKATSAGYIDDQIAHHVWDDDYKAVYHMNNVPTGGAGCIKDSTSNQFNGTPNGSMASDDLVDGAIGKALDLDGTDDYISIQTPSLSTATVQIIGKETGTVAAGDCLIGCETGAPADALSINATSNTTLDVWAQGHGNQIPLDADYTGFVHVCLKLASNGDIELRNVSAGTSGAEPISGASIDNGLEIGRHEGSAAKCWPGIIDEIRISSIERQDAWIKADYKGQTDDLILFSNFESLASIVDNIYIDAANSYQTEIINLSSVSGTMNEFNTIKFEITNDDLENIFYIDNLYTV